MHRFYYFNRWSFFLVRLLSACIGQFVTSYFSNLVSQLPNWKLYDAFLKIEIYQIFYLIPNLRFKLERLFTFRASNSSRNSWTSNIEYLAIKYSNSSSISNSTNTTKNGSNYRFLTIFPWIMDLHVLNFQTYLTETNQKRFVRAINNCRNNVL